MDSVSTAFGRWSAGVVSSATGLRVEVNRVTGSWIKDLKISGLRLSSSPEIPAAWTLEADTLSASFRLLPLVRRRVVLNRIEGAGVRISLDMVGADTGAVQREDRAGPAEVDPVTDSTTAWVVSARELQVRGGRIQVREAGSHTELADGRDVEASAKDPWVLDRVRLAARDLRLGSDMALEVDSLSGRLYPGGGFGRASTEAAAWGSVVLSGGLNAQGVRLDTLHLESTASRLSAAGSIPMSLDGLAPENLDLHVTARPLHLADLGPLLPPAMADSLLVQAEGRARFRRGSWDLDLHADAGGAGSLTAEARLWRGGGLEPSTLGVRLETFDLGAWGLTSTPRRLDLTVDAEADSMDGSWIGTLSARIPGVSVEGSGSLTPGGPTPWQLSGQGAFQPSDVAPALGDQSISAFHGTFAISGEGRSLESLVADGEVRIDSVRVADEPIRDLVANGSLRSGEARVSISANAAGGSAVALARADLRALPELQANGSVEVESLDYRGFRVDSAAVQVRALNRQLDLRGRMALQDSVRLHLTGRVEALESGLRVGLDSLRFSSLDLTAFGPLPATRLNGLVKGSLEQMENGWTGEAALDLNRSAVGAEFVRQGRIDARVDSSGLEATVELALDTGVVQGEGRVSNWSSQPRLHVPRLTFRDLDPAGLLGRAGAGTRVSGWVEADARGTALREATGRVHVVLDSSMVMNVAVPSADLEAVADSGVIRIGLFGEAAGGAVRLEGRTDWSGAAPSFQAEGSAEFPDLRASAVEENPGSSLFARFGAEGVGSSVDSLDARAWVEVDSAGWDQVDLEEGRLTVGLSTGVLRVDTLVLRSEMASFHGAGRIPLSTPGGGSEEQGELRLVGEVHRADLLAPLLNAEVVSVGEATLQASARGALDDLDLRGRVNLNALLVDQLQVRGLEFRGEARRRTPDGFTEATAHLAVDELRTSTMPIRRLDVDARLEGGDEVAVEASGIIDDSREGSLTMRVEGTESPAAIRIERFEFRADEDNWRLSAPARVDLSDGVDTDSLLLSAGDQSIRVRGRVGRTGPLDLNVEVQDFRIGTVSDLAGFPAIQGQVGSSVTLGGRGEEPTMHAEFRGMLDTPGAPTSDLALRLGYENGSLSLEADAEMGGRPALELRSTLPLRLSLADSNSGLVEGMEVTGDITADSLQLEWLNPFLSPETARKLEGVVNGRVRLLGRPEAPVLQGALTYSSVAVRVPALGVRYRKGRGALRFQDQTVFLDSLSLQGGDGSLSGSGSITFSRLDRPEYDLKLSADGFQAMASSGVNAVVSGDLNVSGTSLAPVLEGRLSLLRGDLYLEDLAPASQVESVVLTEADYRELARVFGYQRPSAARPASGLFDAMALDLVLDLRRDSWVRQRSNPEMAVQFTGNLSVRKEAGDSLELVGEVEGVPGRSYVEQFGRRFSLANGQVVFQGAPSQAQVDLRAEYEVPSRDNPDQPEVVITLDISGTPQDLSLELSSSPQLEASDMVSYLAVGRPADRTLAGGEGSLGETGGALALGRLSGAVEAYAREQVGLDVVEITTDGLEGVTLLAGRYLTPDLYLGIRQPLSLQRPSGESSERTPDPEVELELQAVRWLLLNLQAGGRGGVEFFVRSRISYE